MKPNCSVTIAGLKLKNPVLTSSGTFGYGDELKGLCDLSNLGGIITKTITLEPRPGNPPPRIAETASGMLNAIGLQNIGLEAFLADKAPFLKKLGVPVVVSIAGRQTSDYVAVSRRIAKEPWVAALELNLSCPNLNHGIISQNPEEVASIVAAVTGAVRGKKKPVIAKLSPKVTSLSVIARAAKDAGADALSVVNTFPGMAIDVHTRRPKIKNVTGGMSGPAIKPLAVCSVFEIRDIGIPIIGGGGISTGSDAVEFLLAGASAVSVGTASFVDPNAAPRIAGEIAAYMSRYGIKTISEIVGKVQI